MTRSIEKDGSSGRLNIAVEVAFKILKIVGSRENQESKTGSLGEKCEKKPTRASGCI